jgi:hypothetical protein
MYYLIRCLSCGATQWCSGTEESDTNAWEVELDDDDWHDGNPNCTHEEYEGIDWEYPDQTTYDYSRG